jgi:hypothetical protein
MACPHLQCTSEEFVLEDEKQLPIVEKVMEKKVETEKMREEESRVVDVKLWGSLEGLN